MEAKEEKSLAPWFSRVMAIIGYLGLTPLQRLFRVRLHDTFLRHHQAHGLVLVLLLLVSLLTWPVYFTLEVYLVRNHIGQPSDFHAALAGVTIASLTGLGLWALGSIIGMARAAAGSTRTRPFVARLARQPWLMRGALVGDSVLLALVGVVVGLAIHACSMARDDVVSAPVYYLYDNRDHAFLGTWGQKLFCYRIARVAQERWGKGRMVVAPITVKNLHTAITQGRFVVLLSHGNSGAIRSFEDLDVWPNTTWYGWPKCPSGYLTPGKGLQFVYIAACGGGERRAEWEQRFAPAEVASFDRLSSALEHLWWLWFNAPERLKEIR
jgi:hypothetical protein